MKREFKVIIEIDTKAKYEAVEKIRKAFNVVFIKCLERRRTSKQNRALHLYFTLLAEALNDSGYDMKKTIRKEIDINWNDYNIKEFLWRPIQLELTGQKSTTRLKTGEIDDIYYVVNRVIGERTGVFVEFPSIENLLTNG